MLAPILIFALCFVGGTVAAAHWLPDLEPGRIGGLAFFTVCGLLGIALSLFGLHIYSTVKELDVVHFGKGLTLAGELEVLLKEVGAILGLAGILYLLAPRPAVGTAGQVGAASPAGPSTQPGAR
ncbi:MAG TPA: hypothetical protein VGF95_07550 [Solirubrobacteraceae bacterium]|jgi:hypothetical protein